MNNTSQNTSVDSNSSVDSNRNECGLQSTTALLEMELFPTSNTGDGTDSTNNIPRTIKQFQPLRFVVGLSCTSSGVAIILSVGLRVVEMHNISNDFAMPLVAVCVLTGVMLLGGGFGVMATSSSGFDEAEFDRLATAGNISAASQFDQSGQNIMETQQDRQSAA